MSHFPIQSAENRIFFKKRFC